AGTDAWLGNHTAHSAHLERGSSRGGGLTLSGSASHGAGAVDCGRMGIEREQPACALLPADGFGAETVGGGARKLAKDYRRGWNGAGFRRGIRWESRNI